MASDVLIVEHHADVRELMAGVLENNGYKVRVAESADRALADIEAQLPHVVLLNVWLLGSRLDGLQLLALLNARHPDLPVIVTGTGEHQEKVAAALQIGAHDFIDIPCKAERLGQVVSQAVRRGSRDHREWPRHEQLAAEIERFRRSVSGAGKVSNDNRREPR
jgi:two-component system nitrogen regulation response regulator NtrX